MSRLGGGWCFACIFFSPSSHCGHNRPRPSTRGPFPASHAAAYIIAAIILCKRLVADAGASMKAPFKRMLRESARRRPSSRRSPVPQRRKPVPAHAAATKLSITNFRPALSKSTVSLGPSTATTSPGPNLLCITRDPGGTLKRTSHTHGPRLQKSGLKASRSASVTTGIRSSAPRSDASRAYHSGKQAGLRRGRRPVAIAAIGRTADSSNSTCSSGNSWINRDRADACQSPRTRRLRA